MNELLFVSNGHLTLGVEIEVQIINAKDLNLFPISIDILKRMDNEKIKPELFQSMMELNSGICSDVHEVKNDLVPTLFQFYELCEKLGASCSTTGTHPFANYSERILYPSERYFSLLDRNQWIAQRLSIFGLHVHLGMRSKEDCILFMNFFQHFLPHLVVLSASSPFWQSINTGLASSRLSVFEASPTSGHFQWMPSWEHFENQVVTLKKCGAIGSTKDLWWDMRPCPHFGTLEIRICDGTATFHELLGIVALIHSLAHWFNNMSDAERKHSHYLTPLPLWLIRENKWRALRYGLDMEFISSPCGNTRPIVNEVENLVQVLLPITERLGYADYMEYIQMILAKGNSACRQIRCFAEKNNLESVVELNMSDFEKSFIHNQICI